MIKKAILTGGGRATRLYPVTATMNKHLLPLAGKPMIFHAIEKVVEAGVEEIFINTNPGEAELQKYVGDGGRWGVRITFFEQTGGPQGIAHVVNEAERFIGDDPFMFYLSDNIVLGSIRDFVQEFERANHACMLALSEVPDPERFGVPVFDSQGRLIDVLEKPENPPSRFAVTGMYLYGPKIFFDTFKQIERSARGEYEISSVHSHFLKHGRSVGHKEITGWWKDTGKPEDLLAANALLLSHMPASFFVSNGAVDASANIRAPVRIGAGARIGPGVSLIGPVIIGENAVVEAAQIGPNVSIGTGCVIRGGAIEHSIILDRAIIEGPILLRESIVGKSAVIRDKRQAQGYRRMIVGEKTVIEAL